MEHRSGNGTDAEGWVTTRQAAEALSVKPRQIRSYISEGMLEAKTRGEGASRRYLVSATSVEALQAERRAEGELTGQNREINGSVEELGQAAKEAAGLARELAAELAEARYRLGRAEARLEFTAQAGSTLQEQLHRERERADRLEAERERLVPDLLREKDRANAERERAEHFEAELREALEVRRGWLRRFFGF
jgi:DNA-binding transcriptional MerR regulator